MADEREVQVNCYSFASVGGPPGINKHTCRNEHTVVKAYWNKCDAKYNLAIILRQQKFIRYSIFASVQYCIYAEIVGGWVQKNP